MTPDRRPPPRPTLDDLIEMQRQHRERMADELERIHRARWGDWRGR